MAAIRVRDVVCILLLCAAAPDARAAAPLKILYIGNSYTYTHDIPGVVRSLAVDAGFPEPLFGTLAQPSWFLSTHCANPDTATIIDTFELDVVVLQEQSLRPTDPFNPGQFKADAAWFYDRVKARSPNAKIVLYETWARAPGDALYPTTFTSPALMQDQLRAHYTDAASNYIPAHSAAAQDGRERCAGGGCVGARAGELRDPASRPGFVTSELRGRRTFRGWCCSHRSTRCGPAG